MPITHPASGRVPGKPPAGTTTGHPPANDASTGRVAATGPMPGGGDQARGWLRSAMLSLAVLAAAAAAVSWDAQYVMVSQVKHTPAIAALEAAIPDVGALIFATLGIALALHGKRAIRARTLNVACVAISLAMNALAAAPGWRDLAIWVMPSAVYALASDTLISVIRAWVIAATRHTGQSLADDEPTPMAVIGGLFLWLLRLTLGPISTLAGFRRWALDECPTAPGRKATHKPARTTAPPPPKHPKSSTTRSSRIPGKQDRLIALAGQRHDLTTVPLTQVSQIANTIGAEVSLSPGTARRVLLAHVRALQNGHPPSVPKERTP